MAILNTIFEKPQTDDLIKSLGNMIVSGVENEGNRKLYFNILSTVIATRKTAILVNGALSEEQHSGLQRMIRPHMVGRRLFDLNYGTDSDRIDILSAFDTAEDKAEFLVTLLSFASEMPESLRQKAQRFYRYAMSAMDELGRPYKLSDLSAMDVDTVISLVESAGLPEPEKSRQLRFLSDASMYSAFLDIESCMVTLEDQKLVALLSGDTLVSEMLREGNVVMLNGFLGDTFKKKETLFNTLLYAFTKCLEKNHRYSRVHFLLKDADFVSGDYVKTILEYNASYAYAAYLFVADITKYIVRNGNDLLDLVKSVVVFAQSSRENAEFWSAYFGSRDVQERSYSYTRRKGLNPFTSMSDSGGVVSAPRKYNTVTHSFQKVNKPIYRPEVFQELRPIEAMCYLHEPLMRRKTRIEE